MRNSLFVYGTLLDERIFAAVVGARKPSVKARLHGYARYPLRAEVFPAIVPERDACTEGALYRELSAAQLKALDRYEGGLYQRESVSVELDSHEPALTYAYVLKPRYRDRLLRREWCFEDFRRRHLERYLRRL